MALTSASDDNRPAVTNARFAPLHGLTVGPVPLSTMPAPLRKTRARHERHSQSAARGGGFRLRPGSACCAPTSFQYLLLCVLCSTFRSPTSNRSRWLDRQASSGDLDFNLQHFAKARNSRKAGSPSSARAAPSFAAPGRILAAMLALGAQKNTTFMRVAYLELFPPAGFTQFLSTFPAETRASVSAEYSDGVLHEWAMPPANSGQIIIDIP